MGHSAQLGYKITNPRSTVLRLHGLLSPAKKHVLFSRFSPQDRTGKKETDGAKRHPMLGAGLSACPVTGALAWRGARKEGVALWGVCAAVTGFPWRGCWGRRPSAWCARTTGGRTTPQERRRPGRAGRPQPAEERTRPPWAHGFRWSVAGGAATEGGSGGQRGEPGTEGGMLATKGGSGQGLAWPTRTDRPPRSPDRPRPAPTERGRERRRAAPRAGPTERGG